MEEIYKMFLWIFGKLIDIRSGGFSNFTIERHQLKKKDRNKETQKIREVKEGRIKDINWRFCLFP